MLKLPCVKSLLSCHRGWHIITNYDRCLHLLHCLTNNNERMHFSNPVSRRRKKKERRFGGREISVHRRRFKSLNFFENQFPFKDFYLWMSRNRLWSFLIGSLLPQISHGFVTEHQKTIRLEFGQKESPRAKIQTISQPFHNEICENFKQNHGNF